MKKFIFCLAVLLAAAWYGRPYISALQQQWGQALALINGPSATPHQASNSTSAPPPSNSAQIMKCITAQGKVYYGDVPPNIQCERSEPIKGALSILPAQPLPKPAEAEPTAKMPLSGLNLKGISLPNPEALRPENRIPQE